MSAAFPLGSRGSCLRRRPPATPAEEERPWSPAIRWWLLFCVLGVLLAGCSSVQLVTAHDYILLRAGGASPEVLEDEDPLYAQFQDQVLTDPYLAMLLSIFEHTTKAYATANRAAPVPATAANPLMIVLDAPGTDTLYGLQAHYRDSEFVVELALGLGRDGQVDLPWARDHLAAAMGPLFLGLAGLPPSAGQPAAYETTEPGVALARGFGWALEALYGQDPDVQARWLNPAQDSREAQAQRDRVQQVLANGYLFAYAGDQRTLQLRPREQAMRTPGVVATFFTRLLQHSGAYYPQRYLLWFFAYPPTEVPYAKVLLALNDMARQRQVSMPGFIDCYVRLFPMDREMVLNLADEVFGQSAA